MGGTPASPTAPQVTDETPTDGGTNDPPTGEPKAARRSVLAKPGEPLVTDPLYLKAAELCSLGY